MSQPYENLSKGEQQLFGSLDDELQKMSEAEEHREFMEEYNKTEKIINSNTDKPLEEV